MKRVSTDLALKLAFSTWSRFPVLADDLVSHVRRTIVA